MASFKLTLISQNSILPRFETIQSELISRGYQLGQEQHLNPGFSHTYKDPMGDAFSISFEADLGRNEHKRLCQHLSTTFELDAILQTSALAQTVKKLACFDMDSTLIQHEVMDELAYRYGIGEEIAAITESAMRGEISFKESFDKRLACLEAFDGALIPEIAQSLKLTPGAKVLVKTLRENSTKVAILSGGFENFAVHLQNELGPLDAIHANILEINNGKLTGRISNKLVDESRKLDLIRQLSTEQGLLAEQTIAVGDGANDIPMLLHAGLGVAYRAKPVVQERAPHCINYNDLSAILYILGYMRNEFVEA